MKKLLVFILACLSSTVLFAQTSTHYTIVPQGVGSMYTKLNGVLFIDGVEQANANLEIGVFDQDGICRGAKLPQQFPKTGQWVYLLQIRGNEGFTYTFRVFDHESEEELDLVCEVVDDNGDEITYQGNYTYQHNGTNTSAANPIPLNFSTPSPVSQTFTKEITGYGDATGKTGYYFIASPIDDVDPTTVDGMTYPEGDDYAKFDLYSFNQVQDDEEWRNYKAESFNLTVGSGYLYANKNDVILSVTGTPAEGPTFGVELTLTDGHAWTGWNLVGNPFGVEAYINRPCYTLNGENYVEIGEGEPIGIMQGVLVQANEDEEILTFSTTAPGKSANLSLNLTSESKLVDRAIVSFGNGRNLDKLTFRENSSKLYMTQDSKDYAVVYSEGQGEMPVCFKAEKNGSYNISFTAENAEFSYLHLIDNLTGNDVDLLENPSYSFDARTSDYASRFKLVFSAGNANMGNDFGFISNGNLMVLGIEGEATLQVIDVTGRILSSETFSGNYNKAVNEAQGVYMIRLIQGENVRTQKIVIK